MIKLVIFDLDDTLISEKEYVKSGFKAVSKYIEQTYSIKNAWQELLGLFEQDAKLVFNRFLEKHHISYTKEQIIQMIDVYRTHEPSICFFHDVIPTCQFLKEHGIKIAILSDGYLETQKAKVKAVKADELFDEIFLTDSLGKDYWKPSPKGFEILQEKFKVNYSEMLYVGDNPQKDFYIQKIHPVHTVRILRENSVYEKATYLEDIKEEYTIHNLEELKQIL